MVTLGEITRANYIPFLKMSVRPDQEKMVANNAVAIAQAHFYPEAWVRGIFVDGEPVGFAMVMERPDDGVYSLWRLMIDQAHQGKGYGGRALDLLIAHVRTRPNAQRMLLSHMPHEGNPGPFYERHGFRHTGEADADGELIMELQL